MIAGRWSVQLAAIWHWYFAIMHLYNIFSIVSVHSCVIFFLLSGINKLEWSTIPAWPRHVLF